jgi:hypothetical protein
MLFHIHPAATEGDSLDLEPKALFVTIRPLESNSPACGDHSVPRKLATVVERSHGQPGASGESSGLGRPAVRDHPPPRNAGDDAPNLVEGGHDPGSQGSLVRVGISLAPPTDF